MERIFIIRFSSIFSTQLAARSCRGEALKSGTSQSARSPQQPATVDGKTGLSGVVRQSEDGSAIIISELQFAYM